MPPFTVFYSWQSDTAPATNRHLINDALGRAAEGLNQTQIEVAIDRDTLGLPGSPDIQNAIFSKIEKASAFVADVTPILYVGNDAIPNPNVLIELGFALKVLGADRTILVVNTAHGTVESLPFDIRHKRITTYNAPVEGGRADQRNSLTRTFHDALTAVYRLGPANMEQIDFELTLQELEIVTQGTERKLKGALTIGVGNLGESQITDIWTRSRCSQPLWLRCSDLVRVYWRVSLQGTDHILQSRPEDPPLPPGTSRNFKRIDFSLGAACDDGCELQLQAGATGCSTVKSSLRSVSPDQAIQAVQAVLAPGFDPTDRASLEVAAKNLFVLEGPIRWATMPG